LVIELAAVPRWFVPPATVHLGTITQSQEVIVVMSRRTDPSWEPLLPAGQRLQSRQALGRPYVWEGQAGESGQSVRETDGDWLQQPRRAIEGRHVADRARALIGDELRKPTAWCQLIPCIAHYTHPEALGEADIVARAIASGWCMDAFGRLVCPLCQQRAPLWSSAPPVRRLPPCRLSTQPGTRQ